MCKLLPLENTQKSLLQKNYYELLIFFILFVIASSLVLYQNSLTNGDQRLLIGGDEPHYLVLTSSILKYGSFHIENYWMDPECDDVFKHPEKGCLGTTATYLVREGNRHPTRYRIGLVHSDHGLGRKT